jgi:hypothetical protein
MFHKQKTKVIINSTPRTGARFLRNEMLSKLNIRDIEIFSFSNSFKLFENKYKTITILRDPKDSIVSLVSANRFFGDFPLETELNAKDVRAKQIWQIKLSNVETHFDLYKNFYKDLNENFDSLVVINFHELVNDTKNTINKISELCNLSYRDEEQINTIFHNFNEGFLSTSKITAHYEIVKNNIEKFETELADIYEQYNKCLNKLTNKKV